MTSMTLPDEVLKTDVLGRVRAKQVKRDMLFGEFKRGGTSAQAYQDGGYQISDDGSSEKVMLQPMLGKCFATIEESAVMEYLAHLLACNVTGQIIANDEGWTAWCKRDPRKQKQPQRPTKCRATSRNGATQ